MESLGIQFSSLIFQIINFAVLVAGLNYLLYKPAKKMLAERQIKISRSLKDAEAIEVRLKKVEEDIQAKLDEAAMKSDEIIVEAKKAAEEVKQDIKNQAQVESEKLIEGAQIRINAQEVQMMERIEKQVAALAKTATEKVLVEYLSDAEKKKITDKAIEQLTNSLK